MTPEEFRAARAEVLEDVAHSRQERIAHPPVVAPKRHRTNCPCPDCDDRREVAL